MDVTHNRNDDPRTNLPLSSSENESDLNLIYKSFGHWYDEIAIGAGT